MRKIQFSRGELIARSAAMGFALLLILAYFLLPMVNSERYYNNSGRKKLAMEPGKAYSWAWKPENGNVTRIAMKLSGVQKAEEITLHAQILDESGAITAEAEKNAAGLRDADDMLQFEGRFQKGQPYILILWTEGKETLQIRGEADEETGDFFPMIQETTRTSVKNPALLYFSVGALLAGLTPVRGEVRKRRRNGVKRAEKKDIWERMLPGITFLLVGGLGVFLSLRKPMPSFGIGEASWIGYAEDVQWAQVETMSLWNPGGLSAILGNVTTWTPGYLPLAIGYNLTRIFTANIDALYHGAILCQTLTYAGLSALAVAHATRYKAVFLTVSAMPAVFFLLSSAAFDGMLIGSVLLGIALILEAADQEERITPLRAITMVSLLAFGTAARPAISLALLALLIIPKERFGGTRRAWLFRSFVILTLLWCLTALLVPGSYDDTWQNYNIQGQENRFSQISHMMETLSSEWGKPWEVAWKNAEWLLISGITDWHILGYSSDISILYAVLMLMIAPICLTGEDKEQIRPIPVGVRFTLGGIVLTAEIMLLYAERISLGTIGGQTWYILPLWIMLALAFMRMKGFRAKLGRVGDWFVIPIALSSLTLNILWIAEALGKI